MAIRGRTIGGAAAAGAAAVIAVLVVMTGRWEGLELKAYRDVVGVWTICYGETLDVQPGDVATKAECDRQFAERLESFRAGVDQCMAVDPPLEVEVAAAQALPREKFTAAAPSAPDPGPRARTGSR